MLKLLRTSIVLRSSFIVLAIALCVGGLFAALTHTWEAKNEHKLAIARIGALLSTVENTVSIACYLSDANLAKEVAQGLLKNNDVAAIRITNGKQILSELRKGDKDDQVTDLAASLNSIVLVKRSVYSPFNPSERVCDLELTPDFVFIQNQINHKARFTSFLLMLQAFIMAAALVFVVMSSITRPIKTISDRLHRLLPEAQSELPIPPGNEKDEIGQLVRDVNALFAKLFNILRDERELRIEHEIGERKFRAIFENSETAIFLLNQNGEITSYNAAYLRIFAINEEQRLHTLDDSVIRLSLRSALSNYTLRLYGMMENASLGEKISSEDFVIEVGPSSQKKMDPLGYQCRRRWRTTRFGQRHHGKKARRRVRQSPRYYRPFNGCGE